MPGYQNFKPRKAKEISTKFACQHSGSLLPNTHHEKVLIAMLYFHWLRSTLRRVNLFWYSPWSRKMAAFIVNTGERRTKIHSTKLLQWDHCNKTIAKSRTLFSYLQLIRIW